MDENVDFDSIMKNITGDLTGDQLVDTRYLMMKCEEYKNHDMSREITRACCRLMYNMFPKDKKANLEKMISNRIIGTVAVLDEIKYNIYKKNYDNALKMITDLVEIIEALNMFEDDQLCEYHVFDETFEEILYNFRYKPRKEMRQAQLPYTEIYYIYGNLLLELNRLEEARKALQKGLRWNPMSFRIMSEYIETFKLEGDIESFFEKTLEAFTIAIHASDVARCFRNLGYYFVEKESYTEAVATLLLIAIQ